MAAGDVVFFNQVKTNLGLKLYNLNTDTFKIALITDVVTPVATTANPHFGGTGTTNFKTNEVTPGGNYAANGIALTNVSFSTAGANAEWKADKVVIAQNASNPTNARWGIIYDDTDANKRAIAFVDLGANKNLSSTAIELRWNLTDGNGAIGSIQ